MPRQKRAIQKNSRMVPSHSRNLRMAPRNRQRRKPQSRGSILASRAGYGTRRTQILGFPNAESKEWHLAPVGLRPESTRRIHGGRASQGYATKRSLDRATARAGLATSAQ